MILKRAPIALLIAVLVQGCGKEVEKSGRLAQAQVTPGTVLPTTPTVVPSPMPSGVVPTNPTQGPVHGACADPIGVMNYRIATAEDLTRFNTGSWDIDSVVTYSVATVASTQRQATSALETQPMSSRVFHPICTDMSQLPAGNFTWNTTMPYSISATDGEILEDLVISEKVTGPLSRVQGCREMKTIDSSCLNIAGSMGGASAGSACQPMMVYMIDADHILVVKTTEERDSQGNTIVVKTAAKYELLGAGVPSDGTPDTEVPMPTPVPSPSRSPAPQPSVSPVPVNPIQTNPVQQGLVR